MKIVEVVLNYIALFDLVRFCRVLHLCSHKCFNQLYMNFTRLSIGRWRVESLEIPFFSEEFWGSEVVCNTGRPIFGALLLMDAEFGDLPSLPDGGRIATSRNFCNGAAHSERSPGMSPASNESRVATIQLRFDRLKQNVLRRARLIIKFWIQPTKA